MAGSGIEAMIEGFDDENVWSASGADIDGFLNIFIIQRLVVINVPPFCHEHLDVLPVHVNLFSCIPPGF